MEFFKRHKILTAIILLVLLPLGYFTFIAIKAYLDTPRIISEINSSNKLKLKLEDFSEKQLKTLLTVEDPNFYSHNGIDLSTPGAGYTTITQGLVKVYFFGDFNPGFLKINKLKQTVIAWVFNRRVDKDTQLKIFINSAYFGLKDGKEVIGFGEASRAYFNKEFSQLSDDEFLSLVAMIVAPNDFNIATKPDMNKERVSRIKKLLSGECKPADLADVYYKQCIDKPPGI